MLDLWKLQLKTANRAAERNVLPADFAESVYAMVPDTVLLGMATDPQWFALLCANVPDCAKFEAWYNGVRAKLIELAVEDGILTKDEKGAIMRGNGADTEAPAV